MKRCLALALLMALAATPATAVESKARQVTLAARVIAVTGTVEARAATGEAWKPVKAGTLLKEGADLLTGFRASCIVDMVDSLVQIDPLSVVRVAELTRDGETVRTRLHLKQGNAQAAVEKGRIESDFAILTPSATLAVRGTRGINCRFYPDKGGTYGLAERGLIAIIDRTTLRETACRPGQQSDDRATLAARVLADKFIPVVMDRVGMEKHEKRAAQRQRAPSILGPVDSGKNRKPPNRRVQETRRNIINNLIDHERNLIITH